MNLGWAHMSEYMFPDVYLFILSGNSMLPKTNRNYIIIISFLQNIFSPEGIVASKS